MRLLNVKTYQLESFDDPETRPPYAILSHTWGQDEVLFEDIYESPQDEIIRQLEERLAALEGRGKWRKMLTGPRDDHSSLLRRAESKAGWVKVRGCCKEAARQDFKYVWIDTCCIKKGDSSELSEAINSMFRWYKDASICFAYLDDVDDVKDLDRSRWFTRGWTLQELLACEQLVFCTRSWKPVGSKQGLRATLERVIDIKPRMMEGNSLDLHAGNCARDIMSWMKNRNTTRAEDQAYCLMGMFSVNIPTLYGEGGENAFYRLQMEIFQNSGDHSLFLWSQGPCKVVTISEIRNKWAELTQTNSNLRQQQAPRGLLARSPGEFQWLHGATIVSESPNIGGAIDENQYVDRLDVVRRNYTREELMRLQRVTESNATDVVHQPMINATRVQLLLEPHGYKSQVYIAHLACRMNLRPNDQVPWHSYRPGILIEEVRPGVFYRVKPNIIVGIGLEHFRSAKLSLQEVHIVKDFETWRW